MNTNFSHLVKACAVIWHRLAFSLQREKQKRSEKQVKTSLFQKMITFVAIIILALCQQVQNPNLPPMRNYQCKKCGILLYGSKSPNALDCPSGGYHQWNKINSGDKMYETYL